MSLKHINTIQNPNDIEKISELSNKYMWEALSNLGQRFSLKGDSVSTRFFTTLSVVNKNKADFSDEKLISKLSSNKNKLYLDFFDTSNINNPLYREELKYTINNLFNTDTQIVLNTKINGIDYYKENMLMYLDTDNKFYIVSIGCDSEIGDVELNIDCYNIKTNMLISSIKLIDENDDNYYYIYYLYNEVKETNDTTKDYTILKYKCDKTSINTLYGNFERFISEIYTIIKEYYNQYKTINSTDIFYEIINNNNFISCIPEGIIVHVSYDDETRGFSVDKNYYSEFNYALNSMYNQLIYMYNFMFEYYCNYIYKLDNNQLNKILLYKIFERAYNDSNYKDINKFYLYIPVDYQFNYYCKDTDSFYIYSNETPVNIFYTINNINQDYINKYYNNVNNVLLCPHINVEKIVLYKYSVNYNEKYVNLINGINVSTLYTTPYIQDGYWLINDQKTQYKAIGEDANNPNIILVCTKNISNKTSNFTNKDYSVLSTVNNELLKSLSWKIERVNVNLFDGIYKNNYQAIKYDNYNVNVLIPDKLDIEKPDIGNQLKGALIINMSDINNVVTSNDTEKNQIKSILGEYSFVTTFWVFDETTYSFVNIKNPNSTSNALTLSNLNNINNIIKSQTDNIVNSYLNNIDISKLTFDKCKFNTGYTIAKNEFTDKITGYAILYNKSLNDTSKYNISDFNNPYIFELKYVEEDDNGNDINKKFIRDNGNNVINIQASNELTTYTLSKLNIDEDKNKYSYNYLPADRVPLFNFNEVLTVNSNILNRTNILSLNNDGQLYYAYIGTSIEEYDKSTLHIGTSNLNVDLGIDSLFDVNLIDKLSKHDKLSIDFDTISLNSKNVYKPKVESKFLFTTTIDDMDMHAYTSNMTYIYDSTNVYSYIIIEYDYDSAEYFTGYYNFIGAYYNEKYKEGEPLKVKIRKFIESRDGNYEQNYYDLIGARASTPPYTPPTIPPFTTPPPTTPPTPSPKPTITEWSTYMLVPIKTLVNNIYANIELESNFNKQDIISELQFLDLTDNTLYAEIYSDPNIIYDANKYYVLVDSTSILNLSYYSEFTLNYLIDSNNKIDKLEIISENNNKLPNIKK